MGSAHKATEVRGYLCELDDDRRRREENVDNITRKVSATFRRNRKAVRAAAGETICEKYFRM